MPESHHRTLPRSFYDRPTLDVAADLIGKQIVFNRSDGRLAARIVEVEAYVGQDDPACHAARGQTKRNAVMFGRPGHAYIYFIYGMHHCLNFVTEREGFPAAVLVRAAEPSEGENLMRGSAIDKFRPELLRGPGKFCRAFDLTREQNGVDLCGGCLFVAESPLSTVRVGRSTRIGIRTGVDLLWRFYDEESPAVSGPNRILRAKELQ
ncbi:MAG: DNA-3-methyladenine glycosylase [Candidatus Zixiibacteriota bacterium]